MFFSSLLHWVYCLSVSEILILTVSCCLLFYWARHTLTPGRLWHGFCGIFFLFWVGVVVWMTLLSRSPLPLQSPVEPLFHSYQKLLQGENPEILRSNCMNLILFLPAGLLLPQLLPRVWPRWLSCAAAVLVLVLFSTGIEFLQFRGNLGQVEADDVLHNGLGALLGAAIELLASASVSSNC